MFIVGDVAISIIVSRLQQLEADASWQLKRNVISFICLF
jgi:hypothetical protein